MLPAHPKLENRREARYDEGASIVVSPARQPRSSAEAVASGGGGLVDFAVVRSWLRWHLQAEAARDLWQICAIDAAPRSSF